MAPVSRCRVAALSRCRAPPRAFERNNNIDGIACRGCFNVIKIGEQNSERTVEVTALLLSVNVVEHTKFPQRVVELTRRVVAVGCHRCHAVTLSCCRAVACAASWRTLSLPGWLAQTRTHFVRVLLNSVSHAHALVLDRVHILVRRAPPY